MRFYKFAKIAARNFPTVADLNNPWIFSEDVAVVIEAFHYAKFAEHFADEYKGYNNHLIYNCQTQHLPDLQTIETQLCNLQQFM